MPSGNGRAKIQSSYTRWLQKNTWAAMVQLNPELAGLNPDFQNMSIKKAWAYLDGIEKQYGMDRKQIEEKTRHI